jgi:hypothetical protein
MGARQVILSALAAGLIGAASWQGDVWRIGMLVLLPLIILCQPSRSAGGFVAFAYFAIASWPVTAVCRSFLAEYSPFVPISLWATASASLAMPWLFAWTTEREQHVWRCPIVLAVTAAPPLGIIGWASPLTAAGVLFPGTAWLGLVGVAVLPGLLIVRRRRLTTACVAFLAAAISNITYRAPHQLSRWTAANVFTPHRNAFEPTAEFLQVEAVQRAALTSNAEVIVFPEGAIRQWNEAIEAFWEATLLQLGQTGKIAIIGAGLPSIGTFEYQNAALVIGGDRSRAFLQRIPVPIGMWKPFGTRNGVPLRLDGQGTIDVAGQRVAILICYEQLLVWPIVASAIERPTVLVGMANNAWTRNTNVPAGQRACMEAWARLFGLPMVVAENQ